MKTGRAFWAGVVGGAVMSLLMTILRAMGMPVSLSLMLGTMFGGPATPGSWLVGLAMHLGISGLIALLYAVGFEHVTRRAGADVGVGFAIIHTLLGGLFFRMVPAIHPLVPETMPAHGAFLSYYGTSGVVAFVVLHLIYGAIAGAMYGPVRWRPLDTRMETRVGA